MFSAQEARENSTYPRSQLMKMIEKTIIEESSVGHQEARIVLDTKKYKLYNKSAFHSIEKQLRMNGYLAEIKTPYKKEVSLYIHW